jgi:hypothetical protein
VVIMCGVLVANRLVAGPDVALFTGSITGQGGYIPRCG